ncbi:hypothetical protein F5884DRAFT_661227 [Xylogone sp. PMI_703]|nr:hypothetical protein F5884DRAFT_661227 [Xylogone sp. PMI_703]
MAHFSPSALFSPSVARQQAAAAKDWNYIDSWLSTKYSGRTPPPFERNNETLKALLALAALNETADEERDLFAKVESKSLHELRDSQDPTPDVELLSSIEERLTREGGSSLVALANLSVALNQPFADAESLGRSIVDLQVTSYDLEQASDRVTILENFLNKELEQINAIIEELQSDAYQAPSDLAKQTMDLQRKTKVLATKIPEARDRVASLQGSAARVKFTLEDVLAEEEKFKASMAEVKDLEAQLKSYHGLPQDTDLARLELERLRVDLRHLTRQRDNMFEGLVERESPRRR